MWLTQLPRCRLCRVRHGGQLGLALSIWRRVPALHNRHVRESWPSVGWIHSRVPCPCVHSISAHLLHIRGSHPYEMQVCSRSSAHPRHDDEAERSCQSRSDTTSKRRGEQRRDTFGARVRVCLGQATSRPSRFFSVTLFVSFIADLYLLLQLYELWLHFTSQRA